MPIMEGMDIDNDKLMCELNLIILHCVSANCMI